MAISKNTTQDHKKIIMWVLGAGLAAAVAIFFAAAIGANKTEDAPDGSVSSSNATHSEDASEEVDPTPDTSSPTYYYDQVEEGMSESEVDSILSDYEKDVSTEITFDGEHSKTVTYTGDLPNNSFIVVTVRFTDGLVSYKANYTGEHPEPTPYDSIDAGMSEVEVDSLLSTYHKYEESSSSYGGQTAKVVRYTDSGSTFIITYMNGIVSAKAR